MNFSLLYYRRNNGIREKRLCRLATGSGPDDLDRAFEAVKTYEYIEKNPDLKRALELYDNGIMIDEFPELTGESSERPYAIALLLEGMLDSGIIASKLDYTTITAKDLDPNDPFKFMKKYPDPNALGIFLKSFLSVDILDAIYDDDKVAPGYEGRLGLAYGKIINDQQGKWGEDQQIDNTLCLRVNMLWYRHIQKKITDEMGRLTIRRPGREMEFIEDRSTDPLLRFKPDEIDPKIRSTLTKQQYLSLLSQGIHDFTKTKYRDKADLLGKSDIKVPERVSTVFTSLSLMRFGTNEALKRFGVELGEHVRQAYFNARMAVHRDSFGAEVPSDVASPEFVPPASEWRRNHKAAYEFLKKHLPAMPGTSNFIFLYSLEYHFVFSDIERTAASPSPEELMKKDDTEAALELVTQSLMDYEGVMGGSNRQLDTMSKEITLVQNAEAFMGNAWEYMKDIQSHPLGSSLMWLTAIIAARGIMKKLMAGEFKVWEIGLIAGAAVGLYQHESKGRAWWNYAFEQYDAFMGREKLKDPRERTLANFWLIENRKVKGETGQFDTLTQDKEQLCLALVGQVPTIEALEWYDEWRMWRNRPPASRGPIPAIPIEYYDFYNKLGSSTTDEEVGNYLYLTLQKFFMHRGADIRATHISFDIPAGMNEDEGTGFAYISDKYVTHRFYRRVLEDLGMTKDLKAENIPIEIFEGDTKLTDEEIEKEYPDIWPVIKKFKDVDSKERETLKRELAFIIRFLKEDTSLGVPTAGYPMNHVFYMEGGIEAAKFIAAEDAEAAGFMEKVMEWIRWDARPTGDTPDVPLDDDDAVPIIPPDDDAIAPVVPPTDDDAAPADPPDDDAAPISLPDDDADVPGVPLGDDALAPGAALLEDDVDAPGVPPGDADDATKVPGVDSIDVPSLPADAAADVPEALPTVDGDTPRVVPGDDGGIPPDHSPIEPEKDAVGAPPLDEEIPPV